MSDRTQGSVRTEGGSSNEDPQTAVIPSEEPGAGKPAAKPAAGAAPGWGGATPSGRQAPAGPQAPAGRPAGQPPAGPTQPAAAKPGGSKPTGGKQAPAKQAPPKQAPPKQAPPAQGQPATVGARAAAPQTGARPANRDAGAPRQGSGRPSGAAVRPAESPVRTAGEGERPGGVRAVRGSGGKGPRRARLQLRHIDTWSALKISLVLAIALFFVWMVAVAVLYGVLNGLGVFSTLNDLIGQLGSSSGGGGGGGDVITPKIIFLGAAVIGAVNIVLFTALCTVGTFVYNLCADLVGGLEVTLSERD